MTLLTLAGVMAGTNTALAQDACPLPAGLTAPPDPRVTAQQAENGGATLMDFALAVRDLNREIGQSATSATGVAHLGCLVRQEGSPYRSGSTYLVQMTLDGRVLVHAKDMQLSGRLLNPLIYAGILSALGVSQTDLANLASRDPATAGAAFQAVFNTLSQEPTGSFNIEAAPPIPGVSPGAPAASGYAVAYLSSSFRTPLLLLAGFDLNASHLLQEPIDYGDPTITARDVVDRRTLKEFVTQAGDYFVGFQESGDLAASSKARIALRDPSGPWRHGSVYLYVLDKVSNIVLFHGAFPDRFELRPLTGTARDGVTGELILPQVLEAAASSPEGGFVEYYFDDPNDDSDRADIPKVGYAREFTGSLPRPDGTRVPVNIVVGSGIYLSDPGVVTARQNNAIEEVLPQVMRAMTASTVDAVSSRIQQVSSGTASAKGFSLGNASSLTSALLANGQSIGDGTFDLGQLLAGSSFSLPLNALGTGGSGMLGSSALWGSGDYRHFSGGDAQHLDYDGDVVSAHVGMDAMLNTNWLAGMAVSWSQGSVDYTDASAQAGRARSTLTSLNPYVGWKFSDTVDLWAAAGYGWGEVEVNDDVADKEDADLEQQMVAAGVSGTLLQAGSLSLRLKGETAFTWADVDSSGTLESMDLNASRQRLVLEGTHAQKLASGAILAPSLEIGMRHDGGDGETGSSVETAGSLRYADPAKGLVIEGKARTLLEHSDDYNEWGVSGMVQLDPGVAGMGLALNLQSSLGHHTNSSVQRMWETGEAGKTLLSGQAVERLNARIAYGIRWGDQGVLTPYTDVMLSGDGYRRFSLGGRYAVGPALRMSLEGVYSRPTYAAPILGVMLRGDLNW